MVQQETKHSAVQSRNEAFAERTATQIWCEKARPDNPYLSEKILCHGYDLFELMDKRSYVDMFFLLFKGELPTAAQATQLKKLMIALINPGPRHPATQAAMNAGIGKSKPVHILPIGTAVLGGDYQGGGGIEKIMRFIRRQQKKSPHQLRDEIMQADAHSQTATDLPGFGRKHGSIDIFANQLARRLLGATTDSPALTWGIELAELLADLDQGWLLPGVAAATFADLGFLPRSGGALYQLLGAPGVVAHGLELANKPITAMPYVSDENYVIEK